MAAICKMKLTPEVCLRCGKPAWALFPLCLTWKIQNVMFSPTFFCSVLNVEKPLFETPGALDEVPLVQNTMQEYSSYLFVNVH